MDIYYVVGVIATPYPGFGMIINIVSKEDNFYYATCLNFIKLSSMTLGKKRKGAYYKHMYYEFLFLSKVNYDNDKFMSTLQHMPTTRLICDYLSLSVLLSTSSDANIMFIIMFQNVTLVVFNLLCL